MLIQMDQCVRRDGERISADVDLNQANAQGIFQHRKNAVQFMANLSETLHLSNITLYTAVFYLDRTCKNKTYSEKTLAALAIACLLIASKVDGDVCYLLTIPEILAAAQVPVCKFQILNYELFVLDHLSWNLRVSTLLHYANDFHSLGMFLDGDSVDGITVSQNSDVVQRVTDFVRYFCDLLLLDNMEHSPSLGAASAWAAARYTNGIQPLWCPQLSSRTGHALAEMLPSVLRLVRLHSPTSPISFDDFSEALGPSEALAKPLGFEPQRAAPTSCADSETAGQCPGPTHTSMAPLANLPASPSKSPAHESPTNVTADAFIAPVPKRPRF